MRQSVELHSSVARSLEACVLAAHSVQMYDPTAQADSGW
jgi:hypothetical protein